MKPTLKVLTARMLSPLVALQAATSPNSHRINWLNRRDDIDNRSAPCSINQARNALIAGVLALACLSLPLRADEPDFVLRWPAHEGTGVGVQDTSGNGHDGQSAAAWVTNAGIKSLFFDGEAKSLVQAQILPEQAIGKASWTFMAWLRPEVLGFPGAENRRRLLSFGQYPVGVLHLDLTKTGSLFWLTSCTNAAGQVLSAYDDSASCIKLKTWAHFALVADWGQERVLTYVNGAEVGDTVLPPGWNGSFTLNNRFTLGSSWQNYFGALADVVVWRRALTKAEVQAAFRSQSDTYGVKPGKGLKVEEALSALIESGNAAVTRNQTAQARTIFKQVLAARGVPPRWAAWAELRIAQS